MRTQGTHYPFTLIVKMSEKWLSSTGGKSVNKQIQRIYVPRHLKMTKFKLHKVPTIHSL